MNLTNITQKIEANWNANIMNVTGDHNFSILAKNINITVNGNISFTIASKFIKQKGEL
jgi:hypothetical protein